MKIQCENLKKLDEKFQTKILINLIDDEKILKTIISDNCTDEKDFFLAIWECLGFGLANKNYSLFKEKIGEIMKILNIYNIDEK